MFLSIITLGQKCSFQKRRFTKILTLFLRPLLLFLKMTRTQCRPFLSPKIKDEFVFLTLNAWKVIFDLTDGMSAPTVRSLRSGEWQGDLQNDPQHLSNTVNETFKHCVGGLCVYDFST